MYVSEDCVLLQCCSLPDRTKELMFPSESGFDDGQPTPKEVHIYPLTKPPVETVIRPTVTDLCFVSLLLPSPLSFVTGYSYSCSHERSLLSVFCNKILSPSSSPCSKRC